MEIQPYLFENDHLVRTVNKKGEAWFVAKDVCRALGLSNVSRELDRVDEDDKGLLIVTSPADRTMKARTASVLLTAWVAYMDTQC